LTRLQDYWTKGCEVILNHPPGAEEESLVPDDDVTDNKPVSVELEYIQHSVVAVSGQKETNEMLVINDEEDTQMKDHSEFDGIVIDDSDGDINDDDDDYNPEPERRKRRAQGKTAQPVNTKRRSTYETCD